MTEVEDIQSPSLQSKIDDVVNVKEVTESIIKVQEKNEVKSICNCFHRKHHDSTRLDRLARITQGNQFGLFVCLFLTLATLVCLFF